MGYSIAVLVVAIIGASRGRNTWTSSVKHVDSAAGAQGQGIPPIAAQTTGYAPSMQQHQYPPPNTPTPQGYPQPAPSSLYQGPPPGPAYV